MHVDWLTFLISQYGLSGTKNRPATYNTGMTKQAQLKLTHVVIAPNTNTIKIPMVKNNWKHVPNKPRIDVSAYSEIYMGATTHDPPIEIPDREQ